MHEMMPLIERTREDHIATRLRNKQIQNSHNQIVDVRQFLSDVAALANALPERSFALNICNDRYHFLVSFVAVIVRGECNLLPANKNIVTQEHLSCHYPSCYIIHDGTHPLSDKLLNFNCVPLLNGHNFSDQPISIAADQLSAMVFTSGSTGDSKPNPKTWKMLYQAGISGAQYYLPANNNVKHSLVATVPAQHMYGLETSVLLPLFADVCVADVQPLFPKDVAATLARMAPPRILVTTPIHLKALLESRIDFPPIQVLLSATATLTQDIARKAESQFGCKVVEIYGCSEIGSIAHRATAQNTAWEAFDTFSFHQSSTITTVTARHLPFPFPLEDILEFSDQHRFHLVGRSTDAINIAGKRGSLDELNQLLLSTPGILDGVIFPTPGDDTGRLSALVVAPNLAKEEALSKLRNYVDPIFIPKIFVFVDALPRSITGKLPMKDVLELYNSII